MRKRRIIGGTVAVCLLSVVAFHSVKTWADERTEARLFAEESLLALVGEGEESSTELAMNQLPFGRFRGHADLSPEKREKVAAFRNMVRGIIGRVMVLRSEIDFSAEQKGEMKKVFQSHKNDLRNSFSSVLNSKRALDKAITAGQSEEELKKAADGLGDSVAQLALEFAKTRQEARKVMTAEQKTKIDETKSAIWKSVDQFREKVK